MVQKWLEYINEMLLARRLANHTSMQAGFAMPSDALKKQKEEAPLKLQRRTDIQAITEQEEDCDVSLADSEHHLRNLMRSQSNLSVSIASTFNAMQVMNPLPRFVTMSSMVISDNSKGKYQLTETRALLTVLRA